MAASSGLSPTGSATSYAPQSGERSGSEGQRSGHPSPRSTFAKDRRSENCRLCRYSPVQPRPDFGRPWATDPRAPAPPAAVKSPKPYRRQGFCPWLLDGYRRQGSAKATQGDPGFGSQSVRCSSLDR